MYPDDREVREFLTRSMVARVAVFAPSGRPFITPLWFVCDRGRIHMPHAATGMATRYVTAQPKVVLLFDAERGGGSKRTLRITGDATVRGARLTASPGAAGRQVLPLVAVARPAPVCAELWTGATLLQAGKRFGVHRSSAADGGVPPADRVMTHPLLPSLEA
jgi:hypothetical protein